MIKLVICSLYSLFRYNFKEIFVLNILGKFYFEYFENVLINLICGYLNLFLKIEFRLVR